MTLSRDQKKFDALADQLGINLLTGMKGPGKSYLAKPLLLKLIVEESKLTKKIFPD
ncbi:MAG TPA: hypothetical protein VEG44_03725 [Candidatus Acidoferrales bacterium]|nr:hypothetical protein [Candidatus Acidoferrales bacterium]